jgi:hypothetical protein
MSIILYGRVKQVTPYLSSFKATGCSCGLQIPQYTASATTIALLISFSPLYMLKINGDVLIWSLQTALPQKRHVACAERSQ